MKRGTSGNWPRAAPLSHHASSRFHGPTSLTVVVTVLSRYLRMTVLPNARRDGSAANWSLGWITWPDAVVRPTRPSRVAHSRTVTGDAAVWARATSGLKPPSIRHTNPRRGSRRTRRPRYPNQGAHLERMAYDCVTSMRVGVSLHIMRWTLAVAMLVSACASPQPQPPAPPTAIVQEPTPTPKPITPEEVAAEYFSLWQAGQYGPMYEQLSTAAQA